MRRADDRLEAVEAWFVENAGRWVSGAEIGRLFGVTRSALWKYVRRLEEKGYRFETAPRRGYLLADAPDRLTEADVLSRLDTRVFGRQLLCLEESPSTQDVAAAWIREGAGEGAVVVADRQSAGRGRMGRSWHSPPGTGLWFSVILKPNIPVYRIPQLGLVTAVALCRAVRLLAGVSAALKWPNDLLVGDRKAAGILLESSAEDERVRHVVVGIGVNVNADPDRFPEPIRHTATSLSKEAGRRLSRAELLAGFLGEFERMYELYLTEGFEPFRTLWDAYSATVGKRVAVRTADRTVKGVALGLDPSGALEIRLEDGTVERVVSGECEQCREAEG